MNPFCYSVNFYSGGGEIDISRNQFTQLSQDVFEPVLLNLISELGRVGPTTGIYVASSINI